MSNQSSTEHFENLYGAAAHHQEAWRIQAEQHRTSDLRGCERVRKWNQNDHRIQQASQNKAGQFERAIRLMWGRFINELGSRTGSMLGD